MRHIAKQCQVQKIFQAGCHEFLIMMADCYGINTILSPIHEFVITMLDYYKIDTTRLHDDNSKNALQNVTKWLSYLAQLTMRHIAHIAKQCQVQKISQVKCREFLIMMPDYYGINTILSSIHEFVITMLDYYRIDTARLHDDNSKNALQNVTKWLSYQLNSQCDILHTLQNSARSRKYPRWDVVSFP